MSHAGKHWSDRHTFPAPQVPCPAPVQATTHVFRHGALAQHSNAAVQRDPEESRPAFARLRALRDELRDAPGGASLRELSMGMSADFEVAIEEGATLVRVGTALFGARENQA